MPSERCVECGFDSEAWTDDAAVEEVGRLGSRWSEALAGLSPDDLQRRPITGMWSIAEYADHVREVLFSMRFVLDSALSDPGVDLGAPPEPEFTHEPRTIDARRALQGLDSEAQALRDRFCGVSSDSWTVTAVIGGETVDLHWICRHAVHDAQHHLDDVRRLRAAL